MRANHDLYVMLSLAVTLFSFGFMLMQTLLQKKAKIKMLKRYFYLNDRDDLLKDSKDSKNSKDRKNSKDSKDSKDRKNSIDSNKLIKHEH